MHARPHRRRDQLPLRSLRHLRSRWVFAPVRPRLARWEHNRPQRGSRALEELGTCPRHVLYFISLLVSNLNSRKFFQVHVFPVFQSYSDDVWIFSKFFWIYHAIPVFRTYLDGFLIFWTFMFQFKYKYSSDTNFSSSSAAFDYFRG